MSGSHASGAPLGTRTDPMTERLDWARLLNPGRFPKRRDADVGGPPDPSWLVGGRAESERDHDRVLFSTPLRRLGDKTQVFPLEKNDSVRTRLTHSHEVSNLARSAGVYLANGEVGDRILTETGGERGSKREAEVRRTLPAVLAAVGLAHDLGNPPFGHQGENAIRTWVAQNRERVFGLPQDGQPRLSDDERTEIREDLAGLDEGLRQDFLNFEGNAQTLRVVTRLQVVKDDRGLALTYGTLAALMKYTVGAPSVEKEGPAARRKVGFFASERELVERIHAETGLSEGLRHPLTFVMEACDDIAYSVIDAEDAVKKQIVSFPDLVSWIRGQVEAKDDELTSWVLRKADVIASQMSEESLSPAERNDIAVQLFRVSAINGMMSAVLRSFEERYDDIMACRMTSNLIAASKAKILCGLLKRFDRDHAYQHRRVLEIELAGFNVIHGLMDMLWRGITERERFRILDPSGSRRHAPFAAYAYSRISENYRRVFERSARGGGAGVALPIRYRELQLLTDMISGMTDNFAVDLHAELSRFRSGVTAG